MSSGAIDSASEQPAFASGISTVFVGIQELRRLGHEVDAGHDDDARLAFRGFARERQTVADHIGDAVEDLWRLIVVREDDRLTLALEAQDRVDVGLEVGPFHRGDDVADALVEGAGSGLGVEEGHALYSK